jgi:hypothetical protein
MPLTHRFQAGLLGPLFLEAGFGCSWKLQNTNIARFPFPWGFVVPYLQSTLQMFLSQFPFEFNDLAEMRWVSGIVLLGGLFFPMGQRHKPAGYAA